MKNNSLKMRFMAIRFAMWDLHLYLDTHPNDEAAARLLRQYEEQYEEIAAAYAEQYGPFEPSADIVKILNTGENNFHLSLLLCGLESKANKRRVSHNVRKLVFSNNRIPINTECISFCNVRIVIQR